MKKRALCFFLCMFTALCLCLSAQAAYSKLQRGDASQEVYRMQTALSSLGYPIACDGKYGAATERTVRQFQKDQGLTQDGVAGNLTLTRLYQLAGGAAVTVTQVPSYQPSYHPSGSQSAYQKLKFGDSGSAVLQLQSALNSLGFSLKADGVYGAATTAAVRAFQRANGLSVDGIAGANTQRLLYSILGSAPQITSVPTAAPTIAPVLPTAIPFLPTTPAITAAPSAQNAVVVTGGGSLNLRQYPSGTVIASIPNGSSLSIVQYGSTWCEVYYGSTHGYVMTSFLRLSASQALPTAVPTARPTQIPYTTPSPALGYAVVIGGSLNLRSSASVGASVLLSIPNGSILSVITWGETWTQVDYEGYVGYVMTRYLSSGSSPAAVPTAYVTQVPAPTPTVQPVWPSSTQTPAAYDTTLLTRTLRSGYTGGDVYLVQQTLAALNYLSDSQVSGTYDNVTMEAVKRFQQVHGLTVDGLAGKKTFAMLFSGYAVRYSGDIASYQTLHIYYESSVPDANAVQKMQKRLLELGYALNANGRFDETTYMAVLSFQLRNGLTVSGAADAATQSRLYGSGALGPGAPAGLELEDGAGYRQAPQTSEIKLLHWFNAVKPSLASGAQLVIYDPTTHLSWNLRMMSAGRHADCEPLSLRDTLIMFRALGQPSWTVHPVYVLLPDGQWTMATMHNRPHLTGSIQNNGFDGHLCVHFLRDMNEAMANDPEYGVTNQNALRTAWRALTGETVN